MQRFIRHTADNYSNIGKNQHFLFAMSHTISLYRHGALFTFIPKNACSTMRTTFAYENGMIRSKNDFHWIHKNNHTFSASLADLINAQHTFIILRCPYARLVSVYLDKIVNRDRVAWDYLDLYNHTVGIEDVTFEFFVRSMLDPRIRNGNIHWKAQEDFFVYEEYDEYFSVEEFHKVEEYLMNMFGIELIDARPLTGHGTSAFAPLEADECWHMRPYELLGHKLNGLLPSAAQMYNRELARMVRSAFRNDLKLYKEKIGQGNLLFQI